MPTERVGLLFMIASVLTLVVLSRLSPVLSRLGNFRVMMVLLISAAAALIGLISLQLAFYVSFFFILHETVGTVLRLNYDIYLEEFSRRREMGLVRGLYLTSGNVAWVAAPLITGWILGTTTDYWKVFLAAAGVLLLAIAIAARRLKNIPDLKYRRGPFLKTLFGLRRRPNIFKVTAAYFILSFFFSWMVIYMPIYLHEHIGFDWSQIGVIFSIMLLPFAIFELPLGVIADRFLGEKEFMLIGFILLALSSLIVGLIETANIALWASVLFLSRVGASFVEIMSETYFFKKVAPEDANTIEAFRDTGPLAYIVGPAAASLILANFPINQLFIFLAVIMIAGLYFAGTIKDTR